MGRPTPTDAADGWRLPVVPDWGFESEPNDAGTTSRLRRGRVLGGTSWLTRFAVRGAAADFDAWAARGNPGWSFAEVLPAFRRIEADAEYGDRPWHGDGGPIPITRYPRLEPSEIHAAALEAFDAVGIPRIEDHNEPGAVGAGPMPMSSRDGVRVTSADAYLADGARPPNLVIRTDAMVASVVLESGRATAVQLDDGTLIRADLIVLAAGTYGSPTILMRSGIGPAGHLGELGIPVRVDLPGVGANLADHPAVELDSGWRGQATDGPALHTIATFRSSSAPTDGPQDLMFWITDPDGPEPGFWFDPVLLKPRSRGSVRLRSADPAAPPRIRLPGLSEAHDIDRLVEAYRLGLELAGRPEIRRHAHGSSAGRAVDPGGMAPPHRRERLFDPARRGDVRDGTVTRARRRRRRRRPGPWRRPAARHRRLDHPRRPVGIPAPDHDHAGRAPRRGDRPHGRLSCQSVTARSPKAAPCGSFRIDIRPPGKSIGATSSCAPASSAVRCDASTSFTVKYTSQ